MAYSQAVRTGDTGYTTISEFGRSLVPPAPRSAIGFPLALMFSVTFIAMMFLPVLFDLLPLDALQGWKSLDKPVVIASVVLGAIAGFRSAVSAVVHNESVHSREMGKWAQGVVCRRCGHRFSRPDRAKT